MNKTDKKLLPLCIGNLIICDEGVGIHILQQLEQEELPDFVECLDRGMEVYFCLNRCKDHIVMIDAAAFNDASDSIQLLRPQFSTQYPRTLTADDSGLKDLLD